MAYLGTPPDGQQFYTIEVERFSGTGSCTQFTIARSISTAKDIEVLVNNVQQDPDNSYSIASGVITFTEAPSSGSSNIIVTYRVPNLFVRTQIAAADIFNNVVSSTKMTTTGVTAATYGNTVSLASVTVDSAGRIVAASNVSLNTGVTATTYGGTSAIPVITVDSTGRLTSAANASIDSGFNPFLLSGM